MQFVLSPLQVLPSMKNDLYLYQLNYIQIIKLVIAFINDFMDFAV